MTSCVSASIWASPMPRRSRWGYTHAATASVVCMEMDSLGWVGHRAARSAAATFKESPPLTRGGLECVRRPEGGRVRGAADWREDAHAARLRPCR
ncbi:protein of unknown function (plasmid) [Rhodovastum atsumiense]|nr:protein of unknown function [Rhodovastum atsumiense]